MATYDPFKTIHPENRSELAEADLEAFQKDLIRYINDLSDEHIIVAVNHFASQQSVLGSKNTKIRNPLSIENVLSSMISKLDEDEVKNLTNKSISHFRKCSDPDDKDHNLYLSDAIKLDIIMQRNSLGTPLMDNFQII